MYISHSESTGRLGDTCLHAWEVLGEILKSEEAQDIVCDIGMYVGFAVMFDTSTNHDHTQAGDAQERYL